jgi:hypothetical protein
MCLTQKQQGMNECGAHGCCRNTLVLFYLFSCLLCNEVITGVKVSLILKQTN